MTASTPLTRPSPLRPGLLPGLLLCVVGAGLAYAVHQAVPLGSTVLVAGVSLIGVLLAT